MAIHDVLLRLVGDDRDARDALAQTAAELEAFARISANAKADVDTGEAKARIDQLIADLDELDLQTTDVNISADIAGARANLEAFREELDSLPDQKDVKIDVNRSVLDRLQGTTREINSLRRAADAAGKEGLSFGQRIAGTAVSMGPFTTQLRTAVPIVLALAAAITSIIAAVGALIASLAEAVAGLGALAVAFGGVLIPAIGLAVAGIQRFQAQADKAGTAAHALQTALGDAGDSLKSLEPAVDPVFRAMASGLRNVQGLVRAIRPAFMQFGRAGADAVRVLGNQLASPEIRKGFADLIRGAAGALKPMAQIVAQLGRILLNVARAAMPFLVQALHGIAGALHGVAQGTSNITVLRAVIGVLVGQLQSWLRLIGAISSLMLGFFRAAAGPGQQLVEWLTKGVQAMADWVNSAEGQQRIAEFFQHTLPLAEQLVSAILKLALIFIEIGEVAAPAFTLLLSVMQPILNIVIDILDWMNRALHGIGAWGNLAKIVLLPVLGGFLGIVKAVQLLVGVLGGAGGLFRGMGRAASVAWRVISAGARAAVGLVRAQFNLLRGIATGAFHAVLGIARTVWNGIKSVVRTAARGVVTGVRAAWNGLKSVATTVFHAVLSVVKSVMNTIRNTVRTAARGVVTGLRTAWNALKSVARAVWNAVLSVVRSVGNAIKSAAEAVWKAVVSAAHVVQQVVGIVRGALEAVLHFLTGLAGDFFDAGKNLMEALANGIKSAAESAVNAVKDAANSVKDEVTSGFGLFSPSRVFRGYGQSIMQGLALGIRDAAEEAARAMADSMPVPGLGAPGVVTAGLASTDAFSPARAQSLGRRIAISQPAAAGGRTVNQEFNITTPPAPTPRLPDERTLAATLGLLMRRTGARTS